MACDLQKGEKVIICLIQVLMVCGQFFVCLLVVVVFFRLLSIHCFSNPELVVHHCRQSAYCDTKQTISIVVLVFQGHPTISILQKFRISINRRYFLPDKQSFEAIYQRKGFDGDGCYNNVFKDAGDRIMHQYVFM